MAAGQDPNQDANQDANQDPNQDVDSAESRASADADTDAGAGSASMPSQASPENQADPAPEADASSSEPSADDSNNTTSPPVDHGMGMGGTDERDGKLSAFIELTQIPSGVEAHRCVVVELPNTEPVWVSSVRGTLGDGSHHLIVDRRTEADPLELSAFDCSPTMAGDTTRLLIAQQRETTLNLPPAVGYLLEAHQRIFLQLHYINVTDEPLTIRGEVELLPLPDDVTPIEARSMFTGSTAIDLGPHASGSATHFQTFPAEPPWHVFAMTSHTHQLGVRATIERVSDADAPETEPLHESLDWAEPPLTVFEQPLTLRAEDDGLRLTCRYMNPTDRSIHFGVGVEDEMCFMWLYYFVDEPEAPEPEQ